MVVEHECVIFKKIIMPSISIITAVYNADKYISRCIESVLAQTFSDWELILVDDGSKDSSLSICETFAKKDKRIIVISQDNSGPSTARNKGIEIARGEYICFVDSDDWVEPSFLETYINEIEIYDIAFMGFTREDEIGNTLNSYAENINTKNLTLNDFVSKLYLEDVFGWTWCKIFRRNIIENYNIRFNVTMRRREDTMFTIDYMKHCTSAKMINNYKYHYFEHSGSLIREDSDPILTLEQMRWIKDSIVTIANDMLNQKLLGDYLHDFKFTMLMALMNKPNYRCNITNKKVFLKKYYQIQKTYPEIKQINTTKNAVNYHILECILQTRCTSLIINLLPIL